VRRFLARIDAEKGPGAARNRGLDVFVDKFAEDGIVRDGGLSRIPAPQRVELSASALSHLPACIFGSRGLDSFA